MKQTEMMANSWLIQRMGKRMNSYTMNNYRHWFRMAVLSIIILVFLSVSFNTVAADSALNTKLLKEQRDDGLTVIIREPDQDKQEVHYLSLIIKTGYAHDPVGKFGITNLTNELIYQLLRHTYVLGLDFQTCADYSAFHFVTTREYFNDFCAQVDWIIRSDALLYYDLCNTLTRYHLNQPKPSELQAISQLYSMVYGPEHPYNSIFKPDYDKLDITEVNKWFRQIFKPNNFIIASSLKLPDDFLRRPAGRDLKEPVILNEIPDSTVDNIPELKWTPVHDNIATVCLGFETPKFDDKGIFATFLLEEYLNQRLWKVIREENGLSYDPQVFSLLISKSFVPTLQTVFHTLAPDTAKVISLIIAEFKQVAAEGIPEAEIAKIIGRERKRQEMNDKDLQSAVGAAALYGLLGREWMVNREEYLTGLNEEAKIVSQVMTEGLSSLKISVAGPDETSGYLTDVTNALASLTDE